MAQQHTSINQFDDLRKEVAQRYEQLHPDLKAALVSVDTAGAVYEIGKKFGMNIEKTGRLADVIGYTMIGLLPVADFMQNLKDTLEIDGAKAEEISREVNAKIFLAIREQLKKAHGEKWDEGALRKPPTDNLQPITTPTKPTTTAPVVPAAPKSPWEIRPDGMTRETRDRGQGMWGKSVVPSPKETSDTRQETTKTVEAEVGQETRNKRQETTPPEPPKTREAPQPAPVVPGPGVLREITPLRIGAQDTKSEARIMKPVLRDETAKTAPPENLPFTQEVEKLVKTPELEKPAVSKQPEALKPPQPPQPTSAPKPQAPLQAPASTPAQRYAADPYREPIE